MRKKILLGICGGIAAYKTPDLVRRLQELDYEVKVVVTKNALAFVTKLTLETLLPNNVFEFLIEPEMQHIKLAKWADTILIAPATANTIAKLANGFADDLLTTICLASQAKIILVPAMNTLMWENKILQENVTHLRSQNVVFLGPERGIQACGDNGPGRMLEPTDIIEQLGLHNTNLENTRILITLGGTREYIDPVRFIGNRSSGKMGHALATAAFASKAEVTVIAAETSISRPPCHRFIKVTSSQEMFEAVKKEISNHCVFISSAAVSDFTVVNPAHQKIKRGNETLSIELKPTIDILQHVCQHYPDVFTVGFAAETDNIMENAKKKHAKKRTKMLVVNDVSQSDIGFESDENSVNIILKDNVIHLDKNSKITIAVQLLKIISDHSCKK